VPALLLREDEINHSGTEEEVQGRVRRRHDGHAHQARDAAPSGGTCHTGWQSCLSSRPCPCLSCLIVVLSLQFKSWDVAFRDSQVSRELRSDAGVAKQLALLEQSKKLCGLVLDTVHTDVLTVQKDLAPLPRGSPQSTVGIMLTGCLVDNVLVGGPACSIGIEKGDKLVAIDGVPVTIQNIHDHLLGGKKCFLKRPWTQASRARLTHNDRAPCR